MDLNDLRTKIDKTDDALVRLISERMDISAEIAAFKKENNLPVFHPGREREKLADVLAKTREDLQSSMQVIYQLLFELSRSHQNSLLGAESPESALVAQALEETPKEFPRRANVVCQGVEGAYSSIAAERLFSLPSIQYVGSFDAAFSAVEHGFCDYAVLPIENSSAGSVKQVYDSMVRRHFYIVRSVRLKIDHSLLAKPGVKLEDVREVLSHEQALTQCGDWLQKLGVKTTPCENTAVAARTVAESDRTDLAALSSTRCAELYGLKVLQRDMQDKANNHTRFICVSSKPQIFPGADRTSLMMILPHRPGSLYKALAKFYALGINLLKLESRPLPERDFEFMFYFDLETSVYSSEFRRLLSELGEISEEFRYLGSYSEVM